MSQSSVPLYRQVETDAAEAWDDLQRRFGYEEAFQMLRGGAVLGYEHDLLALQFLAAQGNQAAVRALEVIHIGKELLWIAATQRNSNPGPFVPDIEEYLEKFAAAVRLGAAGPEAG